MNEMKVHDEIDEWIAGALCEALSPEEEAGFQQHLARCPHCNSLYKETQKMNEILNHTMPELRPDSNFEGRMVASFRDKVSTRQFHPLRWLAWLAQFRVAQAAMAMLLLAAMIKGGALLTGERFPAREGKEKADIARDHYALESDSRTRGVMMNEDHGWNWPAATSSTHDQFATETRALNQKKGADLLSAMSVTTKSGQRETTTESGNGSLSLGEANIYTGGVTLSGGKLTLSGRMENDKAGTRTSHWEEFDWQGAQQPSPPGKLSSRQKAYINGDLGFVSSNDYLSQNTMRAPDGSNVAPPPADQPADVRKLIRNAHLEIEVEKFEDALKSITEAAGDAQGYVATQDSERSANGKFHGSIVVKVLPAKLDAFLLKLREFGDLKNQTIGTEDVTKDYFDTDARLRNAKRMEERLLDMLQKNTGKVSDLLQVEKELGRVREQIEKMQGQLKYYDALVQYATVTIALREKDLNQPAAYLLKERANLSVFAKDVEKAFAEAKNNAESAKAQTLESHIERNGDGSISATLRLLIAPEGADDAINRMKTLGRIQNYNSQTERVANAGAQEGTGDSSTAKIKREKVELNMVIQRDEEAAVQQTRLSVLTDRVEEKAAQIRQSAASAGVEIRNAAFNRTADGVEISSLVLRMPVRNYEAFLEQVKSLGKVKEFTVDRTGDVTAENAPVEIQLRIFSRGNIVTDDTGIFATCRRTLSQGFMALMWSVRMIGVSLAFVAPWGLALGLVVWLIVRRKRV